MRSTTASSTPTVLDRGVDPRTTITFATKSPHRTAWIEITHPVDAIPQGLLDDLAEVGFARDARFHTLPPYPGVDANYNPTGYDVQEVMLASPAGTDLFSGWTADEARTHMAAARRVMRRHGVTGVPVWRKTLHDLL